MVAPTKTDRVVIAGRTYMFDSPEMGAEFWSDMERKAEDWKFVEIKKLYRAYVILAAGFGFVAGGLFGWLYA